MHSKKINIKKCLFFKNFYFFFESTFLIYGIDFFNLWKALLQRTPDQFNNEAVLMNLAILKYTKDYPTRKPDFATEITDQIFSSPLRRLELRFGVILNFLKIYSNFLNFV